MDQPASGAYLLLVRARNRVALTLSEVVVWSVCVSYVCAGLSTARQELLEQPALAEKGR